MGVRVTTGIKPKLSALLRSHDLEVKYAYITNRDNGFPDSLSIIISGIMTLPAYQQLEPWAAFVISPYSSTTLELYTALPDDIEKCIIK